MDQGYVSFADLPNLGGRMTLSRGIRPSVCHIVMQPRTSLDRVSGTLEFTQAGRVCAFPDAVAPGPVYYHRRGRDLHRWSLHVYDRRWKWKYPKIDGEYNRRDAAGTLPTDLKTIKQLIELCLDSLGESSYDTSKVTMAVYPPVSWDNSSAALELEWLCDLVCMTVVLRLDNTVSIVPINDANGAELPNLPVLTLPDQTWKMANIPSTVKVTGGKTIIQSRLTLEPVAPDTDGTIKSIASLSYRPFSGWDFPEFYSDVQVQDRPLAFQYVYRWFRPTGGWDGDGIEITTSDQIELLPWLAETGASVDIERPLKPVVIGKYWPWSDHPINSEELRYDGDFRIIPELGVIEFSMPVFQLINGEVADPEIDIICAYTVKNEAGTQYSRYSSSTSISASNQSTDPLVLHHPEMTKVKVVDSAYPLNLPENDNSTALDEESLYYLDAVNTMFTYSSSTERHYEGIVTRTEGLEMDGAISQIEWTCGDGYLASTRVGRYTEFDLKTIQYRQARAMNRLAHMAGRMGL